ncbi:MAG: membrane protein insertion efficiency factor YidD [Candidatus Firestonebacteria bacterium]
MKYIIIFFIKLYKKLISPFLMSSCRFYPTCSEYALTSIYKFGVLKGSWMSLKRILRCHPLNPGGYNPVEEKE